MESHWGSAPIIELLLGLVVLGFGKRLFWLFVAAVGFLYGFELARGITAAPSDLTVVVIGIVFGLVGAIIAYVLQRAAIGLAGFLVGGRIALVLVGYRTLAAAPLEAWLPFLIGGLIGAVLLYVLFDPVLIVLSSLLGATLIGEALPIRAAGTEALVVLALAIAGIAFQSGFLRQR